MRGDTLRRHLQARFAKCICTSCEREGCRLGLDSLPRHSLIIIDADKYKAHFNFRGKICDYILSYMEGHTTVGVIELKSGLTKVYEAEGQMKNGAKVAEQITASHKVSNFLPILLHGRGISRLDVKHLREVKVFFQGKKHYIIIERCGSQLWDIFRNIPPP